jgi:hypothetical protein
MNINILYIIIIIIFIIIIWTIILIDFSVIKTSAHLLNILNRILILSLLSGYFFWYILLHYYICRYFVYSNV